MSSPSQCEVGTTVPSTPTAAGENFLYGFGGGGDSPARLEAASDKRIKFTLRAPYYRRGTPSPGGSRTHGPLLGSPVRFRGPSQTGPLVRARQPAIPLSDYPTPPRPAAHATWQDPIDIFNSLTTLDDLLLGSCSGLARSEHVATGSSGLCIGHMGPASDDLSTTVALVTMAAVRETIQGEILQREVEEHNSGTLSDFGTSVDSSSNTWDIEEQVRSMEADLVAGTEDHATQLKQLGEAKDGQTYVPPSSPLAPLMHDDAMPVNAADSPLGENLFSSPPRSKVEPLTISFLECCSIPKFNPRRPTYTNFDLLMRLGNQWGWTLGITKTELKQMLKLCTLCGRYMYAERRAQHRCDSPNLDIHSHQFDFSQSMLSFLEHSGLSATDLTSLLSRCNDCNRIIHITPGVVLGYSATLFHRCSSAHGATDDFW